MPLLKIKYKFPSLNDYISAERTNKHIAAKMKKELTELVAYECKAQKIPKMDKVKISYTWFEKNKRRDKDNIAFNKKFIQDGLVHAGVIKNDNWEYIKGGFADDFILSKYYGVEVMLEYA